MTTGRLRLLLKLIDGFVDLVDLLRLIFALRIAPIAPMTIARVAVAATVTAVALVAAIPSLRPQLPQLGFDVGEVSLRAETLRKNRAELVGRRLEPPEERVASPFEPLDRCARVRELSRRCLPTLQFDIAVSRDEPLGLFCKERS